MSELRQINSKLASIQGIENYQELLTGVIESQQRLAAAKLSKLGATVNETIMGFTALTQTTDVSSLIDGGIVLLTEDPSGINIKKNAPPSNAAIATLTEEASEGGFLNIDVTAGTPQAVAKALRRVSSASTSAIQTAVRGVAPEIAGVTDKLNGVVTDLQKGIGVVAGLKGSFQQFASKLQSQVPGELLDALGDLPSKLAADVIPLRAQTVNISGSAKLSNVTADITFVSSQVEAQAIFATTQREITELVVGTTQTHKDIKVRPTDVTGWHFIITREGELQQVLNIDEEGEYAKNHNKYSVGVAFVGGLASNRREPTLTNKDTTASSASITREQFNTFDKLLAQFFHLFPYGQVVGVSDIDTMMDIPGFDVIEYVRQRFGKTTVLDTSKPSLSLQELQARMALAKDKLINPEIEDEPGEVDG
jgi:N-acetylmuramoyl-L-alanine amidase